MFGLILSSLLFWIIYHSGLLSWTNPLVKSISPQIVSYAPFWANIMVELTRNRSLGTESRPPRTVRAMAPAPPAVQPRFEACASTASLFLYAQGSTILCLHHDTLAIERRFQSHQENIVFISVDNVSERGAGRLVVSYDVGQTAIVWDIFTGTEIARFASFDHLRIASWMRNGHVAFGERIIINIL